jgi:hypothetical protein
MFKRNLPFLLAAITLVSVVSPTFANTISKLRGSNPNTRINVRQQPTINSKALHYGLPGDPVEVLKCVPNKDARSNKQDDNWCQVKFVKSKAVGWVRSDFIMFNDGGE